MTDRDAVIQLCALVAKLAGLVTFTALIQGDGDLASAIARDAKALGDRVARGEKDRA